MKRWVHLIVHFSKTYWRHILAIIVLLLAVFFFRNERDELKQVWPTLLQANSNWVTLAALVTLVFVFFQAGMYKQTFKAVGAKLPWVTTVELFLKRNFLSVFLPAGGISALAYEPARLRRSGAKRLQAQQASGLYAMAGLLSLLIVAVPILATWGIEDASQSTAKWGLFSLVLLIAAISGLIWNIRKGRGLFLLLRKYFPAAAIRLSEQFQGDINKREFILAVVYSLGVELCGILHLYLAMYALTGHASLSLAAGAYLLSVITIVLSPFLRGLGAVEITMALMLQQSGLPVLQALSIVILYRVFEFWLPLVMGLLAFAFKGKDLFIRLIPALMIFSLGLVNIISVVTPPLAHRLRALRGFISPETLHASAVLTLFLGFALLLISAWLIRGIRVAWYFAVAFASLSLLSNLVKGLDYEESVFALITLILLLLSSDQYRIRTSWKWFRISLVSVFFSFLAVCLFGFISFYFIDKRHFGVDFSWSQSIEHTARIFLLKNDDQLHPLTRFGHEFIWVIRILGFLSWAYLILALGRPFFRTAGTKIDDFEHADSLLAEFGNSPVDYFKTYPDKLLFFASECEGFLAYRVASGFAIVLEEPVCAEENKISVLVEFFDSCRKMGLKPAFYRVDEDALFLFREMEMRHLFIGQEAILDISVFSLEGKDRKSMRNGLNSLAKKGFTTKLLSAPQTESVLSQLQQISDEWLSGYERTEMTFSQGVFSKEELRQQDIIVVENEEQELVAFLNIIPDYRPDEVTYDLIRKKQDAPGGCMDALIVKLIEYGRQRGSRFLNLGMVPLSGMEKPENPAEQLIRFLAANWKRFQHYQTLRDFKEKYASSWENKYLVYKNDFDLLQMPAALQKIMKVS